MARTRSQRRYTDPITGDEYGLEEHLAWLFSGLVRHIWVIVLISVITLWIMILGRVWEQDITIIWNYFASWWALVIESFVGYVVWNQMKRDAVILREIRRRHNDMETMLEYMRQMIDKERETLNEIAEEIEEIDETVNPEADGGTT